MTRRRLLAMIVVLGVVWAVVGYPFFVDPARDAAGPGDPADAVVALGGLPYTAVYAERLLRNGSAKHLVVSNPYQPDQPELKVLCPATPPADVTCFPPEPATTRGEAQEIRLLAARNGWDDVIVVAPTWHISRARLIVKRCYSGRLRMVDPGVRALPYDWPALYAYQTFAFLKAAVLRGC